MKRFSKRALAILLAFTVAAVFTASFATSVFAAEKTKTVYLVTKETINTTGIPKYTRTYKYDKNGLVKEWNFDGNRTVFTRNKNGALVSDKQYDGKKADGTCKYKLDSKGRVVKETNYTTKKKVDSVITYTYWSNGNIKTRNDKESGGFNTTYTYRKNGTLKKEVFKSGSDKGTITYNKHGDAVKSVSNVFGFKSTVTHKPTYDKKGNLKKDVATDVSTIDGEKSTTVTTTDYVYTYNNAGNISKIVETKNDGDSTVKTTTTFKYKKVKVAKKYWKALYFDTIH